MDETQQQQQQQQPHLSRSRLNVSGSWPPVLNGRNYFGSNRVMDSSSSSNYVHKPHSILVLMPSIFFVLLTESR